MFCQRSGLLLRRLSPFRSVAVRAVHRSPVSGLERYLAVFATSSTGSGMHLSRLSVAAARALLLSSRPTIRAAPRLVDEALAGEELLLRGAEREVVATIRTVQSLVRVFDG